MVTIDQDFWNFLFGWFGPECMLPEGCTVPLSAVLVAVAVIVAIVVALYRRRQLMEKVDVLVRRFGEKF